MKNNGDFRDSVFGKAQAYEKAKRLARKNRIKTAAAVFLCLLVLIPAVYIPISVSMGNLSTASSSVSTTACDTCAGSTTELATAQQTTAALITTTTVACTTICTTHTTTYAFTYASTTTACGPGEVMGFGSFFNGANHVMEEYDPKYSGFSTEVEYALTDDMARYFSESFFEKNAVITVRLNAGIGNAAPCFLNMDKEINGTLRIDIGLPVTESNRAEATWLIMIPVSLKTLEGVTGIDVYGNDLFVSE
jgi:hypothetical protein